jgi:hypothetical protein
VVISVSLLSAIRPLWALDHRRSRERCAAARLRRGNVSYVPLWTRPHSSAEREGAHFRWTAFVGEPLNVHQTSLV